VEQALFDAAVSIEWFAQGKLQLLSGSLHSGLSIKHSGVVDAVLLAEICRHQCGSLSFSGVFLVMVALSE